MQELHFGDARNRWGYRRCRSSGVMYPRTFMPMMGDGDLGVKPTQWYGVSMNHHAGHGAHNTRRHSSGSPISRKSLPAHMRCGIPH